MKVLKVYCRLSTGHRDYDYTVSQAYRFEDYSK